MHSLFLTKRMEMIKKKKLKKLKAEFHVICIPNFQKHDKDRNHSSEQALVSAPSQSPTNFTNDLAQLSSASEKLDFQLILKQN